MEYMESFEECAKRETLEETINRSMNMHLEKFPKLSKDIVKAFSFDESVYKEKGICYFFYTSIL